MNRCALLFILLSFSLGLVAQTSLSASPQMALAPAPLLVTPEVHLTTVVPAIGATNATPGNTAGASTATAAMPVPPRVVTTSPQFSTAAGTVMPTVLPEDQGASSTSAETPAVVSITTKFDRGVGSGSSVVTSGNIDGKSLGEIARQNRRREAGANARVYTNQDIDRMSQQPGTQVGGMAGAAVGAGNATVAQPQPPSGNMPVVSQPATNLPATQGRQQKTGDRDPKTDNR